METDALALGANRKPWLAAFEPELVALSYEMSYEERVRQFSTLAERAGIKNSLGKALRFVTATAPVCAQRYEDRTYRCGEVATRDHLHDFYNALAWFAFPRAKAAINALHIEEFAHPCASGGRGRARDAATIFDENGMIFLTDSAPHADALREMCWAELLEAGRAHFARHCQPLVFGHALLEKLDAPYKSICAHAWIIETTAATLALPRCQQRAWVDSCMAEVIASRRLRTVALAPLPVLGIPGWCDANCDPGFYRDAQVFRRSRRPVNPVGVRMVAS